MMPLAGWLYQALQIAAVAMVAYLLMLGVAATVGESRRLRDRTGHRDTSSRFLVLVPAHDEQDVIVRLLESLERLDYPRELVDTLVIADNCTDRTAEMVHGRDVWCWERDDAERPGKGPALDWAMRRLARDGRRWDAIVVLDADSTVHRWFLSRLSFEMRTRPGILQAHYSVLNPHESAFTAVSTLAFALQQYVKPLGRTTLGLSPRLLGNGMCLPGELLSQGWGASSISEDLNYYVELLLQGRRTRLVPDAVVCAEMPPSRRSATSQRLRWEKGKLLAVREHVPRLLTAALRRRSPVLADAAIDILLPPFTSIVALVLAIGALALVPAARPFFFGEAWVVEVLALTAYVLIGAALVRIEPRLLLRSLAAAPGFLVWKLWIQVLATLGLRDRAWVRTPRSSEWRSDV